MSFLAARALPGALVADVDVPLTDRMLDDLESVTYKGRRVAALSRYIGVEENGPGDISKGELERICSRPFGCWLCQHCLNPGWTPSADLGLRLGEAAKRNASAVGYADGAHLEMDLEGVKEGTPSAAVIEQCETWANSVKDYFRPLLYVGFDHVLSGEELWLLPGFHAYSSDWGRHEVVNRGFVTRQFLPDFALVRGAVFDLGDANPDELGGVLTWCASIAAERPTEPDLSSAIA